GRELYLQAVEESEKMNAPRFIAKAFLYLAMAEVEAGGEHVAEFVSHAIAATKKCQGSDLSPDLILAIRQLRRTIEKRGRLQGPLQKGEGRKHMRELAALGRTTEGDSG